ncbi:MAG: PspC domain protein [Bacteroidota bacterium]|nr:PspC domain protein [Bacteroidota bacterium]
MIKTFNINLAGQIFNINEDAYEHLSGYFNSLRSFYKDEEEKDEIIRDIEARFAELFLAKGKNYIVNKEDTVEVVNMMGNPQEFDGDRGGEHTVAAETETVYTKKKKRLYRDTDTSLVAGVCAGISNYFGISDPIWIRIAFILLTIFTFGFWVFLIYPILWFVIPEAVTSSEKLEMKGEAITLSNIQKTVREETSNIHQSNKSGIDKLMSILGAGVKIFFKILMGIVIVILGVIVVALGLGLFGCLIALIVLAILALFNIPVINSVFFNNSSDGWFLGIGVLLLCFIPIIFIILASVHVLSKKSKPLTKRVLFPLFGLFMFGILLVNISGYHAKEITSNKKRVTQTFPLNYAYQSDTLQLMMNPGIRDEDYNDVHINGIHDLMDFVSEHKDRIIKVDIEIYPSLTDSFTVVKEYSASGSSDKDAIDNATSFTHSITQINNKIVIDPYIQFGDNNKVKFRNQKLKIKVYVPEGKVIRWDERTENFMDVGKLAINWDNIKHASRRQERRIVIRMPHPPTPPTPPANITINIDPNKNADAELDKAQQKIDEAREKMDAAQEEMDARQDEMQDSIDQMLDDPLHREHYIFKMVNGELVAID